MTPEQLKASLLQYAMEGKLVKQDPNDEPASELLKKIESEKAELVKEGKIKKTSKLPIITDTEQPFNLPESWKWIRLNDISQQIGDIDHKMPTKVNFKSIPYISPKDFTPTGIDYRNAKQIDEKSFLQLSKKFKPQKGDFIFPRYGTIGKIREIDVDFPLLVSYSCCVIRPSLNVERKYVYYGLQSKVIKDEINRYINKSTQPNVGLKSIQKFIFPLPPLEEQKRIVAKIEKLMPLVDEYAESYNRLQKIDNEFKDKLKQAVLQYAMEGKLVKQDPNDEPASEIIKADSMEKINTEPYKIPSSWEWIRLGSGVRFINGRAYKKAELLNDSSLTPVLRVGNLFTNSSWYYSNLKLDEDKYIDNGDLIYAWSASFGPKIWNGGHVIYHYHIWKTVIKEGIDKKFLYYFLSDSHNVLGETKLHGSTMKHVTKTNMEKLPFPLPPLEEQKRIVIRVKRLMDTISKFSK